MGSIVAFWSPLHGRGNSANTIAVAMQLAYKHEAKCVITHTECSKSTLIESSFLSKNANNGELLNFTDTGVDSLERALKTGKLNPNDFNVYCNNISDKCYLLSGSNKISRKMFNDSIGQSINEILEFSKKVNDFTFIDLQSGLENETTNKVLRIADVIVVTLEQSYMVCKEFFEDTINNFDKDKLLIVLGRFDIDSKFNRKYVKKEFKTNVFAVPIVADYMDAINEHKVLKFFKTYSYVEEEPFFHELNQIVTRLLEMVQ